jgi:hypothetical protein
MHQRGPVCRFSGATHLYADLLVYALLLLLYLLLQLLDGGSVRRGAVCLENLNIPSRRQLEPGRRFLGATNSSERGVIFFSSISSSAKFFLYFSQFCPVAEGCT